MIVFKELVAEGFGSLCNPFTFNFAYSGVWLVKGENGVGKTTIFNALCWALYGEVLKPVTKGQVVTLKAYQGAKFQGTKVAVTFFVGTVEWSVVRHIKYKGQTCGMTGGDKLMIFQGGELIHDEVFKKGQQAYIDEVVLGMDVKIFINSVLFGQKMKRLMSGSPETMRQLFDEMFDLHFINRGKELAAENYKEADAARVELEHQIAMEQQAVDNLNQAIEREKDAVANSKANIEAKIAAKRVTVQEYLEKITRAEVEIKQRRFELSSINTKETLDLRIEATSREIAELDDRHKRLYGRLNKSTVQLNLYKNTEATLKTELENIATHCALCGHSLGDDSIAQTKVTLTEKLFNIETLCREQVKESETVLDALGEVEETLARLNEELNHCKTELKTLTETQNFIKDAETYLTTYKAAVTRIEYEIKDWAEFEHTPTIDIAEAQETVQAKQDTLTKLGNKLTRVKNLLESIKFWKDTGFASKGIKAYVFNTMLERLNESVHAYAAKVGLSISFGVDLTKASKPFYVEVHHKGVAKPYEMLSGGQAQLVDVCLSFGLHDLISKSMGIFILDEVFEGLDEANIRKVFDFVRMKAAEGKVVYVITHQDNLDFQMCHTLNVRMANHNTVVE